MYDVDVQLRQRNNAIKLISLVHNQFCSEKFRGMIGTHVDIVTKNLRLFKHQLSSVSTKVRHPAVTFALPHNSLPVAGARQNCASIIFCFSITSATIMLSS